MIRLSENASWETEDCSLVGLFRRVHVCVRTVYTCVCTLVNVRENVKSANVSVTRLFQGLVCHILHSTLLCLNLPQQQAHRG